MEQISEKNSFQIILQSDNADDLSGYWQDQCKYLFDEISKSLPEGSIVPLTLEGSVGEKAIEFTSFSTLVVNELAAKFVASLLIEVFIESFSHWHDYRQNANIKVEYSDKSIITISKQFLSNLKEYAKENPQLSIFEVFNHFKNFKE